VGAPPPPQGLRPCRLISFSLVVQSPSAQSPVGGQAAGAPNEWAVAVFFIGAKPGAAGANTGTVMLSGGGIPDFPVTVGETGALDLPAGYCFWLGDLAVAGANVGDAITFIAAVPS
jgi:hypothetical protein